MVYVQYRLFKLNGGSDLNAFITSEVTGSIMVDNKGEKLFLC